MDFDLATFFEDCTQSNATEKMACNTTTESTASEGENFDVDSEDIADLMGSMQLMLEGKIGGLTDDHTTKLTKERDYWKSQAEISIVRINTLEKRIASKLTAIPPLDHEVVARLSRLEQENRQLKSKNQNLEDEVRELKTEKSLLCDDNEDKSRKLRGASKKVKNAKDVAIREKEKAGDALHQKKAATRVRARDEKAAKSRTSKGRRLQERDRQPPN
jgi:chromosome segregation ATPase